MSVLVWLDHALGAGDGTLLERIVGSFEDRWEGGPRPDIDDYLSAEGAPQRAMLVELIHVDLERRLKAGDAVRVEDYLRRYPELDGDRAVVLDLIAAEYEMRRRHEPDLTRNEYLQRFPLLRDPLLVAWADTPAAGDGEMSAREIPATPRDTAEEASPSVPPAITTALPGEGSPPPVAVPGAPIIAGYEILGELGHGGMGMVYQARHVRLKRLVALKVILPGTKARLATPERFRIEAEAVARLQHPNIVQIYEVGEQGGRPFLCLEYVPGGSLAQKLAGTPQPPDDAARMVQTLARAVHAAHGRGIVHRDLKPANVLLMTDGTPKITDFGLAKQLDRDEELSRSGEVKGTPSYMAPEQAAGKTREVGPAADIYALGAILYDLLTGRPPFKAATAVATLAQVIDHEPVPPGRLHPKLPRDLETICLKCLEKDPRRRYATAEALAEDLRRFLAHEPILARPVSVATRALKWARRRPAEAALVAVLALAVPGALIGVLIHRDLQAQFRLRESQRGLAEQQHLLEQRAAVQALMLKGQGAFAREDWQDAKLHFTTAQGKIDREPKLADLGAQVESLLVEVNRRLEDQARRASAAERFETFKVRRDHALFLGTLTLFTGRVKAADLEATQAAVRDALALFGASVDSEEPLAVASSSFNAAQRAEIATGCYEMLLTLAEVVAQVLPAQPPDRRREQAEQAMRILDRAATLGLDTRAIHQRRARYLAQIGDEAGTRRERLRAEAIEPSTATDFFLLGTEGSRRIADFEEALRRQPNHFWAQFELAMCYLQLQRWDAAKASLTACLGQRPNFACIYPLRALAHAELREFAAAEVDFRKAEGLQPDEYTRYSLLVGRGVMRLAQKRYDDAVADLQAAMNLRPDWYQARVNLAQVYQKQDKLDAAREQLDQAIGHEPALALLYRERARVHRRCGDREAALRDLDRAIRLDPLGSLAASNHAERGRIMQEDGRLQEALRAYDTTLVLRPDLAYVYRWKAETLTQLADAGPDASRELQQQIVRVLDAYFETGPPAADLFRARGQARSKLGDFGGALDDYTHALGIEPDSATHAARGWTYQLAFDASALALRDFEAALRLEAKNGDAFNGRGFARVQLGQDVRGAVTDAEEALRLDPQGSRTLFNAARTYAQAVGRFDARTTPRDLTLARRGQYQDRAVQLLRQAVGCVPAARRRSYWRTIEADTALDPIRPCSGFHQLMLENSEAVQTGGARSEPRRSVNQ
jgi:tetratricopeptide (TPR) repeat protein